MECSSMEPCFRKDELSLLPSLSSLNFVKFSLSAADYLPEKFLLFKACRIYENQLLKLLGWETKSAEEEDRRSRELHAVYLELGNVNLLAHDFARALSAYQKSYILNKDGFWRDASGLYGLGLTYLHFRAYRPAIESFCQLLFCHPYVEVATEVHARLGIAFKCLENFPQSLKHLLIALDDIKELQLIPKYQIRFHIAHCYDGSGDFRRAIDEYKRLLADHERSLFRLPVELLAVVYRQLGWIGLRSREKEFKEDVRFQKLKEAEQLLIRARELAPTDSKTNCYLGLCFSEQTTVPPPTVTSTPPLISTPTGSASNNGGVASITAKTGSSSTCTSSAVSSTILAANNTGGHVQQKQQQQAADKAQDAFVSYRSAIDSDESDTNTWCSIGVLYQQQNQPIDALQAFACAVELDDKHSAAWTELGRLYEAHRQYNECLHCYKKALQHNPVAPETLRTRVSVLEKEFGAPGAANILVNHLQSTTNPQLVNSPNSRLQILPSLENAWQLGIPAQVRQRLSDLHKQQENRYREGSPLWTMSELAAHALRQNFYDLDPTQRQILQVLKINKEQLEGNELDLLKNLEGRYSSIMANNNNDYVSNIDLNHSSSSNSQSRNSENRQKAERQSPDGCEGDASTMAAADAKSLSSRDEENARLKVRSSGNGDELKLRISRSALSTSSTTEPPATNTGLPYITEDDLADVLGDDFGVKPHEERDDPDPLLTAALDERQHLKAMKSSPKSSPRSGGDSKSESGTKRRSDGSVKRKSRTPTPRHHNSSMNSSCENGTSKDDEDDAAEENNGVASVSAIDLQAERISASANSYLVEDLPPAFSLLAPVRVPVTVSSAEILEMCKKRCLHSEDYKPIFDENVPPPRPPSLPKKKPTKEGLLLKTPLIVVENSREASTTELQNFCYNSPIALVHGLTAALKIDLSQFSTKSLIATAPEHEVEVRTQYKMPGDVNLDHLGNPTWACHSTKSFTTVTRYGQYQAESFRHSLKEETEKLKQSAPASSSSSAAAAAAQSGSAASKCGTPLGDDATSASPFLQGPANLTGATPTGGAQNGASAPKRRKTTTGVANGNGIYTATPSTLATTNGNAITDFAAENGGANFPLKMLKFGTNVDLSDERKFQAQLRELNKMPAFCRISAACNMLTHLGHTVLGMNTVQLYMKVPGCRTPGHLENNSFASININIGPGECEWFGVPYEYWPVIERMCKKRNIDFLKGAWWPSMQDLLNAEVPCYRFTQKAGDMVWVGGGCVHWVQATGWCNNVAWNVGPMTANQLEMALYAHEWNRLNTYRSLVPMQHLAWQLARDVRFSNQKIFNVVKNILIRSFAYCRMIADFVERRAKMPIKFQSRQKGETAHYCHLCDIEVFNLLFVKEINNKFRVFCVLCARKNDIDDYVVLQQITFEELANVFDRFQLHPSKAALIC